MTLSESEIAQFPKLFLKNTEAVSAAVGSAAILHWEHIPSKVQAMILRTADLLEPIKKDDASDA